MRNLLQILPSKNLSFVIIITCFSILHQPVAVYSKCTCEEAEHRAQSRDKALTYKLAAIASILVAGALGVCAPIILKKVQALQPETGIHFLIKAFAAGVILATGFIHILPDAYESLTSPCLSAEPWGGFPFTGFIAMMSAVLTLAMEAFATGYHTRAELRKSQPFNSNDDDENGGSSSTIDPGHVHGLRIMLERSNSSDLIRHRVISQVLELGIVVHSVIIGTSLGATQRPKTIKPLIAALSFHQFFEGMGLGGCISQAKFKVRAVTVMILFFSLTTPTGIAIGIGISNIYIEFTPTALIVEGILNSASAGILIYMSLVDLLAADFMNPKLQASLRLQIGVTFTLLLGAASMSLLAKWGQA